MLMREFKSAAFVLLFFLSLRATAQEEVIKEGDTWKLFRGTEAPPPDWNTAEFDDSSWEDGATPIGYGTDLTFKTVLTDMQNGYVSAFIRRKFTLTDASSVKGLRFLMKYDDGFVAYLNGVEVLRKAMSGAPGTPVPFDQLATDHETNTAFEETFLACDTVTALKTGDNVLAIEGHNGTLASSDFALDPELFTIAQLCPTAFTCKVQTDGTVRLNWKKPTTSYAYDSIAILRDGTALTPPAKTAVTYVDRTPALGDNTYKIIATTCGNECSGADALTCTATVGGTGPTFRRGDADANGAVNLTDAVVILSHLFRGGTAPTCLDAADTNDDGTENLTDAVFLLLGLFQGGAPPPAPGRDTCGPDGTTDDSLAACVYASC